MKVKESKIFLLLFIFILFQPRFTSKKLQPSTGFKLGSFEKQASMLTSRPPRPLRLLSYILAFLFPFVCIFYLAETLFCKVSTASSERQFFAVRGNCATSTTLLNDMLQCWNGRLPGPNNTPLYTYLPSSKQEKIVAIFCEWFRGLISI